MSLAKSLRKIGYLTDFSNSLSGIGKILDEQKKKEDRENFFKVASELYNKYKEHQELDNPTIALKDGATIKNVLGPENYEGIGNKKPQGLNLNVNLPMEVTSKLPITPPNIQTRQITPTERYGKSQQFLNEFVNAIAPAMLNTNLDDETLSRANVLLNLAQRQTEMMKPKEPTYFELGEGQRIYSKDPTTGEIKLVVNNPKQTDIEEYERDNSGNLKIYDIANQKYYRKLKKNSQGNILDEEFTRIPPKNEGRNIININNKEKDKSLSPTTAELIADLKNFKPYTINNEGNKVALDPKDIKFGKDKTLERIKLELLSNPRAYEFVNNIEALWKKNDPTGTRQYLSPKELYDETLKHAMAGDIDEEVQNQIANYLRYYSTDIYEGLTTQPEGE